MFDDTLSPRLAGVFDLTERSRCRRLLEIAIVVFGIFATCLAIQLQIPGPSWQGRMLEIGARSGSETLTRLSLWLGAGQAGPAMRARAESHAHLLRAVALDHVAQVLRRRAQRGVGLFLDLSQELPEREDAGFVGVAVADTSAGYRELCDQEYALMRGDLNARMEKL